THIVQAQNTLPCNLPKTITELTSTDYIIPEGASEIDIELRGADGGHALVNGNTCNIRIRGGAGATVEATYMVSTDLSVDALRPNGRLRVFIGRPGQNERKDCFPPPIGVYGAGGGSSAILYLPPNETLWRILAVAGGGGGGAYFTTQFLRVGKGGERDILGSAPTNDSQAGESSTCPVPFLANVQPGGSIVCNLAEGGRSMVRGFEMLDTDPTLENFGVLLHDNSHIHNTGGDRGNNPKGGDGFTGGGAGLGGGGGGGGYVGGGAKQTHGGGGGGSFLTFAYSPKNGDKQSGNAGGSTAIPSPGKAIITAKRLLDVKCHDKLTVEVGQVITVSDIDNGSTLGCNSGKQLYDPNTNSMINSLSFTCEDVQKDNLTAIMRIIDVTGKEITRCNTSIKIADNTPPNAICQDVTIKLDENGQGVVAASDFDNGSTDNCGAVNFVFVGNFEVINVDCFTKTKMVDIEVIDENDNKSTCTKTLTVIDEIPPTVECQDITLSLNEDGQAGLFDGVLFKDGNDNCGFVLKNPKGLFECEDIGTKSFTLIAVDLTGNEAECEAIVTIVDERAPIARCKDYTIALDELGSVTVNPMDLDNGSFDNCSITSYELDWDHFTCDDIGTHTIQLTVKDAVGLSGTCTSNLTIESEEGGLPSPFSTTS
ncbi:MAG: hypothetical protein AAFO07_32770, partial [Bacteroidota bacterium]